MLSMDSDAAFDKIIQNLEFEVEAVHEENNERFLGEENATPLNVKIRVRKKNETGVLHPGFISVPKFIQSNKMPNKIRLVNSNQTIVSFNLLMESDYGQNNIAPSKRKHFFGVFKSGGCMDPQNDDGDDYDYSYMPSSSARTPKTNSIVINTSNYRLKIKSSGKNVNVGNVNNEPKKTKRQKRFFGYCKPGGCLDPPFNEDQYSYKPSNLEQTTFPARKDSSLVRESEKNKNLSYIDEDEIVKMKNKSKDSSCKASEQEKVDSKTIISIFHTDSMKISLDTAYSNSIITYPPTLSSSDLYLSEKRSGNNAKNTNLSVKKPSKPSNEYNDKFFVPPKNNSIVKKTREIVEVLRDPTGLETVLSKISKEKENNAKNDTVINKEERNKKQNQQLNLLLSDTIQSDFDDILCREAPCSTRRDNENSENDSIVMKNNSNEFKNIPAKISAITREITSKRGQNMSIGDFGVFDTKSSKDVSKNKIDIHNEIKCSKLDRSLGSHLQIEKRSNNSATIFCKIGKDLTDSFTKTNIIQREDSMKSTNAIDPLTCIKNEEIRKLNHSSHFDSIAFKNEQGLDTISTNSTKRNYLVSNSDIKKEDIKFSNDITLNEEQSYSDKNSNIVEETPVVNSDNINSQIHHLNKVISNESRIMSDIPNDIILLVPKNESDHSYIKEITLDSSKANPTSSVDSKMSKDFKKSNSSIENESIIKERKFHYSSDSHNYLTKGKRQLTNSSRADSPTFLDSVTINDSPSMKLLTTQVIDRTKDKTEYIKRESKCKERKSHTSTDSNYYLSSSKSQPTNPRREDFSNLLDSLTLNDNPLMEPLSTPLTPNNKSTEKTNKESKIKENMSHNSADSHNYLTKSDRQLTNTSLTDSTNLLDSVAINDIPLMEPLSLSHNTSTENTNAYIEKETKINDEMSHDSNDKHNFLNKSDRQLTSSSCLNSVSLLDSVILNEHSLIEPLSIPLSHSILTENTSKDLFKKSQHLLTKNKSDELFKQKKINVIKQQNHTVFNSSSNLNNHYVNADITKINENIELETKHYSKINNQNKSTNDIRLENNKLNNVSPENESEVSKLNSSFKVHENDFEKPIENSLPIKDFKKLDLHENFGTSMKLLEINEKNLFFDKKHNIDHLYSEKNREDSRNSTDSSVRKFIEESLNLKPNNKNNHKKLLLNMNEKSEHNENKAMEANPNEIIENLSKSINSNSQPSEKLLSPTNPSYIYNVDQVKNKSEELCGKLIDNDSKGENTQTENSDRKSDNIKCNANQNQAFVTILPEGDKFNNITKTQIILISESLHDSFDRLNKSISSYTKINKDIDKNEILSNSYNKTTKKYDDIDDDGIDSTTREVTQFSHSLQSEKSQNSVFYGDASSNLQETVNSNVQNKDGDYVNNTLVRDTASIKHAVIKHSEILSEKRITDDKQCIMDSEPFLPNKNSIRQGSLIELYEQNAISHDKLLNLISNERTNNLVPDPKFASKSRIKSKIILELGFLSYYNYAKNQRVLKSLDTSILNGHYLHDAVTVIKSADLHNDIKISVDSEIDMFIQMKQKNESTLDKYQKANNNIRDVKTIISKKKLINEDKNYTIDNCVVSEDVAQSYEIALEKTLKSVYEQQLIPLQDMLRSLKSEIDNLADQQLEVRGTVFKSHLYPTNRMRSVRLIRTNKRCRCLKK